MRLGAILALALTLLIPLATDAQVVLPTVPGIVPCPVPFIPCGSGGAAGASTYIWASLFPAARILFIATAILMFLQYSVKLLFDPDSQETSNSTKQAYGYAITACAIVGIATFIVETVGQGARETLINPEPINEGIGNIIFYMRLTVAILVSLAFLVMGVRLIAKQGSSEEFENAKTQLVHLIMGIAVILVANVIVAAFLPGSGSVLLSTEIVGIINFTLTIIGALAVFTIIIAGILLVVSVDEALKDRAKKTILVAVIGLVVALVSYVLVRFFINLGFSGIV